LPETSDIIVTHGPPKLYLDPGCPYLREEISRIRPRLHVFGHIHIAHGREDVVLDAVRQAHDQVQIGWGGWGTIAWMAIMMAAARVKRVLGDGITGTTTFVNASAVGGPQNELKNNAIVVEI
ncbi:hypothetical protein QBC35DRAFT_396522, partial [Podospora australis]